MISGFSFIVIIRKSGIFRDRCWGKGGSVNEYFTRFEFTAGFCF